MNINELFEKLCSEAKNDRARATLNAINTICQEQHGRGSKDFSVATISRLGEGRGVPKAQSIHNKTGEIYRALISAWQNANPLAKKPKTPATLDWVENIEDLALKWLVYDLVSANKGLSSELQLCKSVKNLNIDLREGQSSSTEKRELLDVERKALTGAIDNKFLDRRGWQRTERGAIIDTATGEVIFKNGFASGIEKLTSISAGEY
ncbi:gamma-mobile-trio protein GmtX [Thaumasiovibrio sp. DFM-14]|uniref:gamma-mobile-trio protein GmtX n=1 Tax=Thaumasiovibrio sp. DFM-14 TaxID=3384792 RepID=UPI0039A2906A